MYSAKAYLVIANAVSWALISFIGPFNSKATSLTGIVNMNINIGSGLVLSAVLFGMGSGQSTFAMSFTADKRCDVALNYDINIEPKRVIVSDKGAEQYRIDSNKLFVQGKQVKLNDKQQKLVSQYAADVSTQVPEVVSLVNDGVTLATQAVSTALTPLLGDASGAQIDKMMGGVQTRVDGIAHQNGNNFYLSATEGSIQDTFNNEFEAEMGQIVQSSLGTIMMTMGGQLMSADGGSFEAKMNAFSKKMDGLGKGIEKQIESQSDALKLRADKVCGNMESLLVLEKQVRQDVPELAPFPLTKETSPTVLK